MRVPQTKMSPRVGLSMVPMQFNRLVFPLRETMIETGRARTNCEVG